MDIVNANSKHITDKITSRMPTYKIQHVVTETVLQEQKFDNNILLIKNAFLARNLAFQLSSVK